ncbi:MAG: ABC transporter permease [Acidimicrobiia bacterium]|nr:ABC transporter permease [Acidimicrobiia bacterium]MDH4308167.1 ABC transporter permease [Acidimicrobiia bacterium]MDH5292630.1 ABC transporter permease [Acidimicrobiia bacterium]MDH5520659.1 ABC transporter permease [Acidimicrobiia bacterium]
MNLNRIAVVAAKDLRLGPRSPIFLWVLILPVLLTLVLQVAFGSLFDPSPRLGVFDAGESRVTQLLQGADGIEVQVVSTAAEVKDLVQAHDLDAGLVLAADFDRMVADGARPPLELYVAGESQAADRMVLSVTVLDAIRSLQTEDAPVTVNVVGVGDEGLPIAVRLIPAIVMYALMIAGVFLPAFNIADEREHQTLDAMVVTPVKLAEVVTAKGLVGFALAIPMALVTLWLNDALGSRWPALVTVIVIAGLMYTCIGMLYGVVSKNIAGVFTLIKGTGIVLLGPAIFYLFPDWPQWIAKLFPTFWVIDPLYRVSVENASIGDLAGSFAVAAVVIAVVVVGVAAGVRRLRSRLGST